MLPVDGLWFDIVMLVDDLSVWTRTAMLEEDLDPPNPAQRSASAFPSLGSNERRRILGAA